MADTQPYQPKLVYDTIDLFDKGVNSGLDPLLLQKNELAWAINATVRDGFLGDRPPYSKVHLELVWPSDEVETAVKEGLFQGAGYYQPDSGDQSLFAQISGRLFQFTVNGDIITVTERTIPGDPNNSTATQCWMWQSENFLIVNDGIALSIFFDGVTSRRSYGPSVVLGSITAFSTANPPAVGDQVTLTLAAPYTGLFNVPVLINGEYYQPIENTGGYDVILTSLWTTAGDPINVNDSVSIRPPIAGVVAVTNTFPAGTVFFDQSHTFTITLTSAYTGPTFGDLLIFGKIWTITSYTGNKIAVRSRQVGVFPASLDAGTLLAYASSTPPQVSIGQIQVAATAPAIGADVQVTLNQAFSGPDGQIVYIGDTQYTVTAIPATPPGTSLIVINLSDQSTTWPTTPVDFLSVPELPAGRMGAYGLGQNWMCLVDGLSFIAGDVSRGASGTISSNRRDAVLKTTGSTFGGGNFAIPGAGNVITSMTFTANLDTSLGQGSLQVGTAQFMASCLAPIDFSNPPTTGPILTFSLIGTGPLAQNSTGRVNSDIFFRSVYGIGSLIQARRDFDTPGNTPISEEMVRALEQDNQALLPFGSRCTFNNRDLSTVHPQASSQGVIHEGLIAMNLDPVSGIRGKQPPVYDGVWTGINTLQILSGIFAGKERSFAFTFNVSLSKIEIYELFSSASGKHFDDGIIPIVWSFETPAIFREDVKPKGTLISLRDGEFAVKDVIGEVQFRVYYKADQGCWTRWHVFKVCSSKEGEPMYFPRLGLGEPSSALCDPISNRPLRDGYNFQFRFEIQGHCKFIRARFAAVTLPTPKFEPPICNIEA